MKAVYQDPVHGEITVEHDPVGGGVCIEFERLELDDVIMPQYRVFLTSEHVAAWVEHILSGRGRRCRRAGEAGSRKRLLAMQRVTERDPGLVYCMPQGPHVLVVRDGAVIRTPFSFVPMASFVRGLREESSDTTPTAVAFTNYIHGLM